jgi:hypothetical protein
MEEGSLLAIEFTGILLLPEVGVNNAATKYHNSDNNIPAFQVLYPSSTNVFDRNFTATRHAR